MEPLPNEIKKPVGQARPGAGGACLPFFVREEMQGRHFSALDALGALERDLPLSMRLLHPANHCHWKEEMLISDDL